MKTLLQQGNCVDLMRKMPENSVDSIVTDPPYGLEFMGKEWDKCEADGWRSTGGFSKPGIGERKTEWPSFGAKDTSNPTCEICGGRRRGAKKCTCEIPEWKVKGEAVNELADSQRVHLKQQEWHYQWAVEAYRVLKPGGHLLAFGGTRTYHRMVCAIEDAGFEIRDSIHWMYGSGFPKSLNISKAIDKTAGAEREVVEHRTDGPSSWMLPQKLEHRAAGGTGIGYADGSGKEYDVTAPATPEAKQWDGWGTALKPAHEPIVVARKPFETTVAANVLKYGTGGLNIGGCRIGEEERFNPPTHKSETPAMGSFANCSGEGSFTHGRWPANIILSHDPECVMTGTHKIKAGKYRDDRGEGGMFNKGTNVPCGPQYGGADGTEDVETWECALGCPMAELDEQTGITQSPKTYVRKSGGFSTENSSLAGIGEQTGKASQNFGDSGGASRFFYTAKTSKSERNAGCEALPNLNNHPTVKPIALMRYLCRLVTPPGGIILDPFVGSGTTGCAAVLEGFRFIGCDLMADHLAIAKARIAYWTPEITLW
jgi:DNA modification methylase